MSYELDGPRSEEAGAASSSAGLVPGKRALTGAVQRKAATRSLPMSGASLDTPVQCKDDPFGMHLSGGDAQDTAARGLEAPTTALPHGDAIQRSFGDFDVSGVKAHVGGEAASAAGALGATAYATGDHVAFAGQPDLHTAAHEAAHVVQQQAGVHLKGDLGEEGDVYERHADAVADRVVAGQSAVDLLMAGPGGGPMGPVQRKIARPTAVQRKRTGGEGDSGTTGTTGTTGDTTGGTGTGTGGGTGTAPDPKAKVAKLHLYVDVDVKSLGIKDLKEGNVGHVWIALEYNDPHQVPDTIVAHHRGLLQNGGKYADSMGFWPDTENGIYYSTNPLKSYVQGKMRNPDTAHQGNEKASQTWDLTLAEVEAVITYAESKKGAKYSVFFFNCTDFGREAVKAAGKSPPSMSTAGICYPNAAFDGIKKRQEKGVGNTMVEDLDSGDQTTVEGSESKKR